MYEQFPVARTKLDEAEEIYSSRKGWHLDRVWWPPFVVTNPETLVTAFPTFPETRDTNHGFYGHS